MKGESWPRLAVTLFLCAGTALAKPGVGASTFCTRYPTAAACVGGQPACTYCHTSAPEKNAYGAALEAKMPPATTAPRPLSDGDFVTALAIALGGVEAADSDADGVGNLVEIQKGTFPGDKKSFPNDIPCAGGTNPAYTVCKYDYKYVYRKLLLDFCGTSPSYDVLDAFVKSTQAQQVATLDTTLDGCLATEFWRGKNGQLWQLAHKKIRPVGTLKAGEDAAAFAPLADYYADYHLFAWANTDDRDARDVLTADFTVARTPPPTTYLRAPVSCPNLTDVECGVGHTCIKTGTFAKFCQPSQFVAAAFRSGNLTSSWTLAYNVMFTALPRNAAAQAYRGYLGLDIAKQEGLYPIANEPKDYDGKGVTKPLCQQCHATLDPLSYPFRNYNGLTDDPATPGQQALQYYPQRIEKIFSAEAPNITQIPEAGFIMGKPVATVKEWGTVAANSDAFLVATVNDYWKLLMGQPPLPEQNAEFVNLWQRLKTAHNYRVTKMLHELIRTEAYGAP
ncbi:MAG: hypothetical protein H6Q89_4270 [Myxococcaceae bacterium]|nr:hypothetical protein [Myxococcaceae bacterium]